MLFSVEISGQEGERVMKRSLVANTTTPPRYIYVFRTPWTVGPNDEPIYFSSCKSLAPIIAVSFRNGMQALWIVAAVKRKNQQRQASKHARGMRWNLWVSLSRTTGAVFFPMPSLYQISYNGSNPSDASVMMGLASTHRCCMPVMSPFHADGWVKADKSRRKHACFASMATFPRTVMSRIQIRAHCAPCQVLVCRKSSSVASPTIDAH